MFRYMENRVLARAIKKRGSTYVTLKNEDRKYMNPVQHQAMLPHQWGHYQ